MSENFCAVENVDEVYIQMKNAFNQKLRQVVIKQYSVLIASLQNYNQLITKVEAAKKKTVKNDTDCRRSLATKFYCWREKRNWFLAKQTKQIPRINILYTIVNHLMWFIRHIYKVDMVSVLKLRKKWMKTMQTWRVNVWCT